MPFSLLHISDLHRSPTEPIGNDELISTLLADRDRYIRESPPVPVPSAVVVSGDLVRGVPLGDENSGTLLEEQYEIAHDFLCRVADRFAEGDRSRVIIVPGNHDVDWNTALSAMVPVAHGDVPHDFSPRVLGPSSTLRWSWKDQQLYKIANAQRYRARFTKYHDCVDRFYAGADLPYPRSAAAYYQLFELWDKRIAVAAFNSCADNDCFALHGAIPEEAIAQAHLALLDRSPSYDLLVGVWHHNIEGAPYASDYMDVDVVYRLIGKGFRLALHGHQHRASTMQRYIHLPDQEPMAVVSAGSLCAAGLDLPAGVNRQYNVLEFRDDLGGVRVHVREMAIATVFGPAQRAEFGGRSYIDLKWGTPAPPGRQRIRDQAAILDAEQAVAACSYGRAVDQLTLPGIANDAYARSLLTRAILKGEMWQRALEALSPPQTVEELGVIVRALAAIGRHREAIENLERHADAVGMPATTSGELRSWVRAQEKLAR